MPQRRRGGFFMWRYPAMTMLAFMRRAGWQLHGWGFVLNLGRNSGIVVSFMRKSPKVEPPTLTWQQMADLGNRGNRQPVRRRSAEPRPCGCRQCLRGVMSVEGLPMTSVRMIVCAECGNKRCPKATDHRHACTNSNEPGQMGSAYA